MKYKIDKKFIIYITITLIVLIVLLLVDLNLTGKLVLSTDFKKDNHYFTILKPTARLDGDKIIAEPIYFDVKVPSAYDTVSIDLDYENNFNNNISIGLIDDNGNPYLKPIEGKDHTFNLWLANKYRFVVSIPQINKNKPVVINGVRLKFQKDNLNLIKYLYLWVKGFIQ